MNKVGNKNSFEKYVVLFTVLIVIIVTLLIMFDKVDKKEKSFSSASTAMGTYVQQSVYGKNSENAANAAIIDIKNLEKPSNFARGFSIVYITLVIDIILQKSAFLSK